MDPVNDGRSGHLMLDLAILGLLHDQELHGYEIRRRLRDELGLFANISFGSLYPALSRLEKAAAVTVTESAGPPAAPLPSTGSLGGERAGLRARRAGAARGTKRSRKVYRITDHGRRALRTAPRRRRAGGHRRRPELRPAAGVRPVPGPPGPAGPARAPAGPADPAPGRRPGPGRRRPARRLHPLPGGAQHRGHRARHRLARPPHRVRATEAVSTPIRKPRAPKPGTP